MSECKYCKHNKLDRKKFIKSLWAGDKGISEIIEVAHIGIYINNNTLVGIYFDDGVGIEQDETIITCCPICQAKFT